MKLTKFKMIALMLGVVFVLSLSIFVITTKVSNVAFADSATEDSTSVSNEISSDEFVVIDSQNIVPAQFTFTRLNEKECSVRISNKTTATTAIIPPYGEIDNVKYKVTEIATNGFMSSTKLVRVSLPKTLKKIGNMAFSNCSQLERINLSNVETIGNSAFYRCSKLQSIIIPESVTSMGTYVFRYNSTKVKLRAETEGADWSSTWNTNNGIEEIEFKCLDKQPLELESVYSKTTRSDATVVSYKLAGGQPRTDDFYMNLDNRDDYTEWEGNNIFIPSSYKGIEINAISGVCFDGVPFDNLIIEYSSIPMQIGSMSFFGANHNYEIEEQEPTDSTIIINREVEFWDVETELESENIFTEANVKAIVLPSNIERIPVCSFFACTQLENIYFRASENIRDRKDMLDIIDIAESENVNRIKQDNIKYKDQDGVITHLKNIDHSSVVYLPDSIEYIGESAFASDTKIRILIIEDNVNEVGSDIVSGWNNDNQIVFVHNETPIKYKTDDDPTGWHTQWNGGFTKIKYEYYDIKFVAENQNIPPKRVKIGEAVGELSPATVDGEYMEFGGWYFDDTEITEETIYYFEEDIVLTVKIRKYCIFEFYDNDELTKEVKYYLGEVMPELDKPITEEHYDLAGYFDNKENLYFNDKMELVREINTLGVIILHSIFTPTKYVITYDLDDDFYLPAENDENNADTITYFTTLTLQNPTRRAYKFYGWYLDGKIVTELSQIDRDITLKALWLGELYEPEPFATNNYDSLYLIIAFRKIVQDAPYEINIGPSVKEVYIYARSVRAADITMNIVVWDERESGTLLIKRTGDLKLTIDNIHVKATPGKHAIVMDSNYQLCLYAYNSSITGAEELKPTNDTLKYNQGSSAICCRLLGIYTSIKLMGGSNTYAYSKVYIGGTAVTLLGGGAVFIESDNITITGGFSVSMSHEGYQGLAIYNGIDEPNFAYNQDKHSNITISNGVYGTAGNKPDLINHRPYVGY